RAQDVVNHHRVGQVAGLYRAGVQLYRHRAQIADMARAAYRMGRRAYNRFGNRPRKIVASGLPSSSGSRIGRPKYRGRRKYPRRFVKGRNYRSKYKSKKRIMAATMKMKAWKVHNYASSASIKSPAQTTYFAGWDVGLGANNYTVNAPNVDTDVNDGGDIFTFFKKYFGVSVATSDRMVEWKSNLYLTIKNQMNFGCFIKVYYITTPTASSVQTADIMNEVIAKYFMNRTTLANSHALDITDHPGISKEMKITHRKLIKMDPGQTINLKLKASSFGVKDLHNCTYRTRNRYTKSLLLQVTGFPIHDKTDDSQVSTSAIHLDVTALHKFKGRIGDTAQNQYQATYETMTVNDGEGFQFQKGEQADMDT
ncbi:MAG: hypothetical protein QW356_09185, partial [Candidatus Hadarchaeales archaeon]